MDGSGDLKAAGPEQFLDYFDLHETRIVLTGIQSLDKRTLSPAVQVHRLRLGIATP